MRILKKAFWGLLFVVFCLAVSCGRPEKAAETETETEAAAEKETAVRLQDKNVSAQAILSAVDIPAYSGEASVMIGDGRPFFKAEDLTTEPYYAFSPLDRLGRCGPAMALLGRETLPTEERGPIGDIRPSGWQTVKYEDLIEDRYLYNRCHLIAYQLCGVNADPRNLITGTRYMNTEGMLPLENRVADYIRYSGHHVLYRVTPVFAGDDLLARGVVMEALSVEDEGKGLSFCVFAYNIQPGILINYADGSSQVDPEAQAAEPVRTMPVPEESETVQETGENFAYTFILNTNSRKFHNPECSGVADMKEHNKKVSHESPEEIMSQEYKPCKRCHPENTKPRQADNSNNTELNSDISENRQSQ